MSDLLSAAAAAMGLPEPIVERSASARAAETGATVDEVLTEWSGGAPAPVATTVSETVAAAEEPPGTAPQQVAVTAPEIVAIEPDTTATPIEVVSVPYKAPVLVGARDSTMSIVVGSVGLFLVVLLVGLVGPSIPFQSPGARSSELPYSQVALDGQALYKSLGCAGCHTQLVRPVIADVGLGSVTLNDTNQILGLRRFGPDLSDVGSRSTAADIEATIRGDLASHPPHDLATDDMAALVTYLSESRTTG